MRKRDKWSNLIKTEPFNVNLKLYFLKFRNKLWNEIKCVKTLYYKRKTHNSLNTPKEFLNTITEMSGIQKKVTFSCRRFYSDYILTQFVRSVGDSFRGI